LWWVTTGKYSKLYQFRLGSYEPDGRQVPDENRVMDVSAKVSWQATRNSQLHALFEYNQKEFYAYTGNATNDFIDTKASFRQGTFWPLYQLKWTAVLSPKMVLDAAASLMHGDTKFPQQPDVKPGDIPRFDLVLRENT